jgi:hypothetical protein
MNYREYPITPSQPAVNGALCIYVGAGKKDNAREMLIGLSVLRHATEAQIEQAIPFVQASQGMTDDNIRKLLAN